MQHIADVTSLSKEQRTTTTTWAVGPIPPTAENPLIRIIRALSLEPTVYVSKCLLIAAQSPTLLTFADVIWLVQIQNQCKRSMTGFTVH